MAASNAATHLSDSANNSVRTASDSTSFVECCANSKSNCNASNDRTDDCNSVPTRTCTLPSAKHSASILLQTRIKASCCPHTASTVISLSRPASASPIDLTLKRCQLSLHLHQRLHSSCVAQSCCSPSIRASSRVAISCTSFGCCMKAFSALCTSCKAVLTLEAKIFASVCCCSRFNSSQVRFTLCQRWYLDCTRCTLHVTDASDFHNDEPSICASRFRSSTTVALCVPFLNFRQTNK